MAPRKSQDSKIRSNYLNKYVAGSFTGFPNFFRNQKFKNKKQVKKALSSVEAYTLFRPALKKYPRRPVKVFFPYQQIGLDIMYMPKRDQGVKYILIATDCFSRYLWTEFLRKKDAKSVVIALTKLLKKMKYKPKTFFVDRGKEWYNFAVKQFLDNNNIRMFSTYSTLKSMMAERVIYEIRKRLARYQVYTQSGKFVQVFPMIVKNYNGSYNRTIKMRPRDVNEDNQLEVFMNIYGKYLNKIPKPLQFNPGDLVKISASKLLFAKASSSQNWTKENFKVEKAIQSVPVNYFFLEDLVGNEITGK